MKRIRDSHQDVWSHDHEIVWTQQKCALVEDCPSLEIRQMTTRTDQLLCIAEDTGSEMYTRELEAETHGSAKALLLSLKQFDAQLYRPYKKGTNRAMVGLKGLHSSDAFWHQNISASVGLKSFCLWCFKFGGNTEMISTHLREVHYKLAMCNVCQAFISMSVQVVLEYQSKCRMKLHKKSRTKKQDEAS